jgi:hypothetical protein
VGDGDDLPHQITVPSQYLHLFSHPRRRDALEKEALGEGLVLTVYEVEQRDEVRV